MKSRSSCTRRLQFCSGHRVHGHESKCRHLHGHNYVVLVEAEPLDGLDDIGRVIDFSVLKERLGQWIDENWDHGMILWRNDPLAPYLAQAAEDADGRPTKMFLMPSNPTAENMAAYLVEQVCPELFRDAGIAIVSVRLWETENCYADAFPIFPVQI